MPNGQLLQRVSRLHALDPVRPAFLLETQVLRGWSRAHKIKFSRLPGSWSVGLKPSGLLVLQQSDLTVFSILGAPGPNGSVFALINCS